MKALASNSKFRPVAVPDGGVNRIPGFRQTRAKTRGVIGANEIVTTTSDRARTEFHGDLGAFVMLDNGFSTVAANGELALLGNNSYSPNLEDHNARVVEYFSASGLPNEQIGAVSGFVVMHGWGTAAAGALGREMIGHITRMNRVFNGVPIGDSFARARLDRSANVLAEQVWWPELPGTLRDQVSRFQQLVTDPGAFATFVLGLPVDVRKNPGRLAIHHALPVGEKWYCEVTWDSSNGKDERHFDINGTERHFVGWSDNWTAPSSDTR